MGWLKPYSSARNSQISDRVGDSFASSVAVSEMDAHGMGTVMRSRMFRLPFRWVCVPASCEDRSRRTPKYSCGVSPFRRRTVTLSMSAICLCFLTACGQVMESCWEACRQARPCGVGAGRQPSFHIQYARPAQMCSIFFQACSNCSSTVHSETHTLKCG